MRVEHSSWPLSGYASESELRRLRREREKTHQAMPRLGEALIREVQRQSAQLPDPLSLSLPGLRTVDRRKLRKGWDGGCHRSWRCIGRVEGVQLTRVAHLQDVVERHHAVAHCMYASISGPPCVCVRWKKTHTLADLQ